MTDYFSNQYRVNSFFNNVKVSFSTKHSEE